MGDRTSISLRYRPQDHKKVDEIFDVGELERGCVCDTGADYEGDEWNYGAIGEAEDLAKAGVPFVLMHGPGSSYSEGMVVSTGTGEIYQENLLEGDLVVTVDGSGDPIPRHIAAVKAFIAKLDEAEALLKEGAGSWLAERGAVSPGAASYTTPGPEPSMLLAPPDGDLPR